MRLFLCGDVMTGRGVDQALGRPGSPQLHEPFVLDAREYLRLAERASGPLPRPVDDAWVWGDALTVLAAEAVDVRLINLETAITARGRAWPGKGIHYRMHPANVGVLAAAGVDACTLANNHVLDWGHVGLTDTLATLAEAGIATAGAGADAAAAAAPAIVNGVVMLAYGVADSGIGRDWAAEAHRSGVNRLEDLGPATTRRAANDIAQARGPGDLVVVSLHWGPNWDHDIPDEQRRFAHALIDAGAAIVHGHSSHHVKALERYRGGLILYGCGDFINDYEGIVDRRQRYRPELTLMYLVHVDDAGTVERCAMVPLRRRRLRLEHAGDEDAAWLARRLDDVSAPLGTHVGRADGRLLALRPEGDASSQRPAR